MLTGWFVSNGLLQVELLGDLAHRRQHFLAQQADAGLGVVVR